MGVEDQKAVSKRWHEAWGTIHIDEAYKAGLTKKAISNATGSSQPRFLM
ncbi:MAG TPA: hypothetical protein VFU37_01495 [Pyrinomonadaceae bacterium]|nr:hypothetical protein [Pyrinomonadaceae bacterium]